MDQHTVAQRSHLILADIAMAAAIRTYDPGFDLAACLQGYGPGAVRDRWLDAHTADQGLCRRVTTLANAGVQSLQSHSAAQLIDIAQSYGLPLSAAAAGEIADHFTRRREAVLTYRR
ncbi:hypothetical protein GALL_241950 [mine drainage metagenome]|uniref:Uncharacterized protein n=1 Tax=mine drainage metagenome TaxID=410659 RepID=A0A1J5RP03_9ZZZZ